MKEFIAYIIKNLVDNPDQVSVQEVAGAQTIILELRVDKRDMGKVIGREGKTINAIRTLLLSVAARNGMRASLEVLDSNN